MTFWQTSTSWKHTLQRFWPVPNDAEIFKNLQWGDEETVWELIGEGKASIWDINDVGRTPLMVSFSFVSKGEVLEENRKLDSSRCLILSFVDGL
jgi:hypothetical protein